MAATVAEAKTSDPSRGFMIDRSLIHHAAKGLAEVLSVEERGFLYPDEKLGYWLRRYIELKSHADAEVIRGALKLYLDLALGDAIEKSSHLQSAWTKAAIGDTYRFEIEMNSDSQKGFVVSDSFYNGERMDLVTKSLVSESSKKTYVPLKPLVSRT